MAQQSMEKEAIESAYKSNIQRAFDVLIDGIATGQPDDAKTRFAAAMSVAAKAKEIALDVLGGATAVASARKRSR
jgi:hypothetical protein